MNWFLNLSTKAKLSIGFGLGLFSLLVVIITSVAMMKSLGASQQKIDEIYLNNVIDYLTLEKNLNSNRIALLRMMRTRDRSLHNALREEINKTAQENNVIMERLFLRVERDPIPPEKFKELDAARKEFNRVRDEIIIPMIYKGKEQDMERAFEVGSDLYQRVRALCSELSGMASANAHLAVQKSVSQVRNAIYVLTAIGVLVLALSIFMIAYLNNALAVPLGRMTQAASKIAEGDLEAQLFEEDRKDEVGTLSRAFNSMAESLTNLAKLSEQVADGDLTVSMKPRSKKDVLAYSFGIMAENLRGLVKEIKDGVSELEESTTEIITSTRNVYTDLGETEASRQLQVATQRIEELGKRLNMIVSQIKV